MKVTFLKPDFGVRGGFEFLLDRCITALRTRGFEVSTTTFPAHEAPPTIRGLTLPHRLWFRHPEYFSYLANLERVEALRFDDDTVLVTTQPPTYLIDHPRTVALTYHQARVFYDLAEPYVASGYVDPAVHARALEEVRSLDAQRLGANGGGHRWLAGSVEVADRLCSYWGIGDAAVFTARAEEPPDAAIADAYDPGGPALCVSRHAWPKRTELVALAAASDPATVFELVGGGGRQPYVEALAAAFATDPVGAAEAPDSVVWQNQGDPGTLGDGGEPPANLRIHGHLPRPEVVDAYRRCGVVIAPAYREDYGLTVLEAFAFGRPVIVCHDGGGLNELVEGTGAGLVVDPTPAAIATAVRELREDPSRAREMAAAAFAAASAHHATDDMAVLVTAIEQVAERP